MKKDDWDYNYPELDGVYLLKMDPLDDDSEAEEYHIRDGKAFKDGEPWICYGGLWKRVGDLPKGEL